LGQGDTSFTDPGLSPGTNYTYRVRAFNAAGDSPYSAEAGGTTLTTPSNDDFDAATLVGDLPAHFTATTGDATIQAGEPAPPCGSVGKTLWYAYTPAANTALTVSTMGSSFDTLVAVYTGSDFTALTPVSGGCNDNLDSHTPQSRLAITVLAGI